MTDDEWAAIALLLDKGWKGEAFETNDELVYRELIGDLDFEDVRVALKALVQTGKPFRPAAAEIVAAVNDSAEDPVPSWAEVYRALVRAVSAGANAGYFTTSGEKTSAAVAWLEGHSHELVARFFEAKGYDAVAYSGFEDANYGALRQRELRDQWEAFVGTARDRRDRGLALATGATGDLRKLSASALAPEPEARPQLGSGE